MITKIKDMLPTDIKALNDDIQHLESTLSDPNKDWGCEECKQDHIRLLQWLKMLRDEVKVQVEQILET